MSVAINLSIDMKLLTIFLGLVLTLPLLTSCIAVVAGGAAAGGYMLGTDERTVGQITDDSTTTASIKTQLLKARDIKALDINVDTYLQVVTLRGQVYSAAQKSMAIEIATKTKGVKSVVSQLIIKNVSVENIQ